MLLTQVHDLRPTGLGQLGDMECCGLFAVLALHLYFLIAAIALNLVVSRSKRPFVGDSIAAKVGVNGSSIDSQSSRTGLDFAE